MSWAQGTNNRGRKIGYAVSGVCDEPGCKVGVDFGISYVCGGEHDGGQHGCGRYFCVENHLDWYFTAEDEESDSPLLCKRCGKKYERIGSSRLLGTVLVVLAGILLVLLIGAQ